MNDISRNHKEITELGERYSKSTELRKMNGNSDSHRSEQEQVLHTQFVHTATWWLGSNDPSHFIARVD